jgi:serine/threonine protein kinase
MYTSNFFNTSSNTSLHPDIEEVDEQKAEFNTKIKQKILNKKKSQYNKSSEKLRTIQNSYDTTESPRSINIDRTDEKKSLENNSIKSQKSFNNSLINSNISLSNISKTPPSIKRTILPIQQSSLKTERTEKTEKTERPERNERTEKNEHTDQNEKSCIIKLSQINNNNINYSIQNNKPKLTTNIKNIQIANNIELIQQIGSGSYGTVYKAVNKDSKKVIAVKNIKNSKHGLECLFEASIMNSISHPYINSALDIIINENSLNIIQELADTDLYEYCRKIDPKTKKRIEIKSKTLKKWSWQTIQALLCLHKEKIIHGDVKSSNILIFGENTKLCDFTLSIKHTPGTQYTVPTGTPSHRAPEIWMEKTWDESSDIWSLGCTLYEIAYGKLLFPLQDPEGKRKSEDQKYQYLNCIYDFCSSNNQKIPYPKFDIIFEKHRPIDLNESKFNNLLEGMLKFNPRERLTIQQICNHSYFKDLPKSVNYVSLSNTPVVTDIFELKYINEFYSKYNAQKLTLELAMNIYKCVGKFNNYSTDLILLACLLIASKINSIQKFDTLIKDENKLISGGAHLRLLECEKDICMKLNFKLHNRLNGY